MCLPFVHSQSGNCNMNRDSFIHIVDSLGLFIAKERYSWLIMKYAVSDNAHSCPMLFFASAIHDGYDVMH